MGSRVALVALLVLALLPVLALARPQPGLTPQQLIQRAVAAHGGYEKLAQARSERLRLRGTVWTTGKPLPFTNELTLQLPAQYKSRLVVGAGDTAHTVVHFLDGERAGVVVDGRVQPAEGPHLDQLRQTLRLEKAMRLVPLLTEATFTLQPGQDFSYNGGVVTSVRVRGEDQRELVLYFDRETGRLVKSEHRLAGAAGKDVLQEAFYSDYRDVGGRPRAGRVVVQRDGKKVMEAELLDAQSVGPIDPAEFTRP